MKFVESYKKAINISRQKSIKTRYKKIFTFIKNILTWKKLSIKKLYNLLNLRFIPNYPIMKKIILFTTPLALFAMSAYGANYNATLGEGTYNWTDEIWDTAPNNAGTVSVTGVSADKSILNYTGTQTNENKLLVTNATVNMQGTAETPATYNFGAGETPPTLEVVDGIFNSSNATLTFGNFLIVKARGDSEINFNSGTVLNSGFININLAGSSALTFDGITWSKSMWQNANSMNIYTDSSKLVLKNAATLNYTNFWGALNEVLFDQNASIDISGGSSFIGQNGVKLVMSNNAVATVDGTNSALNFSAMQLNNSAKIDVKNGGTVSLADVEINDSASINFLSDFSYSNTGIKASGTSATINIDGATMTRNLPGTTPITVSGNTKLNFTNGATFNGQHNHSLAVTEDAIVTFDNSTLKTATFPKVSGEGNGQLIFKNASLGGSYGSFIFSGNAVMTVDASNFSKIFHTQNSDKYTFNFSENSVLNIQNGSTIKHNGGYADLGFGIQGSAKVNLTGGSTLDFSENNRKFDILGTASLNIGTGANTFKAGVFTMESGATLKIEGSQNTVSIYNLNSAGTLSFVADTTGISTVNVTSEITNMSGMLILDFSRFLGEELTAAIITTADIFTFDEYIGTSESGLEKVNVITRNEGDAWDIYFEDGTLMIAYTAVPEPATYAAIFGALVLGLAIYKRQKNGQERQ